MSKIIAQLKYDWLDFYEFLKRPNEHRDDNQNTAYRLSRFLSVFILNLIVVLLLVSIIYAVESTGLISTENHKAVEMLMSNPALALFAAVIIAPLFEELIFRTYLVRKYSPVRLIVFIAGAAGKTNQLRVLRQLEHYWYTYYKQVIYFSAVLFGMVHISNYEVTTNVLLFSPLIISPQIVVGLCLAYLRIRFGLVWAMFYHAFYNLILIGPALFFM